MPMATPYRFTTFAVLACGAAALAVAVSACVPAADDDPGALAAANAQPKGTAQLTPEYDASGKLQKLEYDRNNDGKVDAWGFMDGARVVRVEVDENGDGRVDRWEYHRTDASGSGAATSAASPAAAAAPAGVDRTVERIERATKLDGTVSRKEFFENGLLTKIEEDTDGDGRIDKWETYRNGSLALLALDTQGRGTPDRRLVYGLDGAFDHMETDATGSGHFTIAHP